MKANCKILFSVICVLFLFSCGNKEEKIETVSDPTMISDSVIIAAEEGRADTVLSVTDSTMEGGDGEYQLNYIVDVEEGSNYFHLRSTAMKVCKTLNIRFDSLYKYYDQKKQRLVLPDDHSDDIYAGGYLLRRFDDGFVSIEMRSAYLDISIKDEAEQTKFFNDTTKMFVFAAMSANRSEAEKVAVVLKKQFPATKIIATRLYMGCMH